MGSHEFDLANHLMEIDLDEAEKSDRERMIAELVDRSERGKLFDWTDEGRDAIFGGKCAEIMADCHDDKYGRMNELRYEMIRSWAEFEVDKG